MKKIDTYLERKTKACFIKVPLLFPQGAQKKSYEPFCIFLMVPLGGHFRTAKIDFSTKKMKNSFFSYPKSTKKHRIQIHTELFCLMTRLQRICIFLHFFFLRGKKMRFFDENVQKTEFFSLTHSNKNKHCSNFL